jgi:ABC-2 type transport system permease protein
MAIARKEVAHISRDFFTLAMALVLPVLVVTVFGVAIEFNLKSIPTAVLDSDKSETSRAVIDTFGSSDYFRTFQVMSPSQGLRAIEGERARAFVVIPPQLEKNIVSGRNAQIQSWDILAIFSGEPRPRRSIPRRRGWRRMSL